MTIATDLFRPLPFSQWRSDPQGFADAFGASFRETGFAVVSGHGLDRTVIDRALDAARAFFALPDAVKRKYFIEGGAGQRGYTPFGVEIAKGASARDLKEFWHVGRELPPGHRLRDVMEDNLYVAEIEDWKQATGAFYDALEAFGQDLLAALELHLKLPDGFLRNACHEGNSILRLLHYPAQNDPPAEGSVRAGAHEDINVITLLLGAEEAGLQALHRNGSWLSVSPPPDAIVINAGDMLQRLTNNAIPSTTHRVLNPAPERSRFARYSTPFFLHFRPDFEIKTLESCVTPDNPDRYPEPISAQDYLLERLREIGLM